MKHIILKPQQEIELIAKENSTIRLKPNQQQ